MKAITVQQPWAWAIVHGGKDVENRTRIGTWRPVLGTRVAIHAGKRWSTRGAVTVPMLAGPWQQSWTDQVDRVPGGVIIGTVEVEDVHPEHGGCCAPWGETSYVEAGGTKRVDIVHLRLANPIPCHPVDCRGALGLWTVPDHIADQLEEPND